MNAVDFALKILDHLRNGEITTDSEIWIESLPSDEGDFEEMEFKEIDADRDIIINYKV